MSASSWLLALLMMWGIVVAIYAALFFPEIMGVVLHKMDVSKATKAHAEGGPKHWPPHASRVS